jgi:hypothetical protein
MRTKGAVGKKKVIKEEVKEVVTIKAPVMTEMTPFGNEEMHNLIAKVNEIIKFINK